MKRTKLLVENYESYSLEYVTKIANNVIGNMPKAVAFEKLKPNVEALKTLLETLLIANQEAATRSLQSIINRKEVFKAVKKEINAIAKIANEIVKDDVTLAERSGLELNTNDNKKGIVLPITKSKCVFNVEKNQIDLTWVSPKGSKGTNVRWKYLYEDEITERVVLFNHTTILLKEKDNKRIVIQIQNVSKDGTFSAWSEEIII